MKVHRAVADPMPGLAALLELISDPLDFDELLSIRAITDPVARETQAILKLIPAADWYRGPRTGSVMAPFMHQVESRFSPGTFGVLYAAETLEIAVRESAYHAEVIAAKAKMSPRSIPRVAFRMRLRTSRMADIRPGAHDDPMDPAVYDPDPEHYATAQRLGKRLRDSGRWSVRYTSVRHPPGSCYGIFVPRAVEFVEDKGRGLNLIWDGSRITATELISTMYLSSRRPP